MRPPRPKPAHPCSRQTRGAPPGPPPDRSHSLPACDWSRPAQHLLLQTRGTAPRPPAPDSAKPPPRPAGRCSRGRREAPLGEPGPPRWAASIRDCPLPRPASSVRHTVLFRVGGPPWGPSLTKRTLDSHLLRDNSGTARVPFMSTPRGLAPPALTVRPGVCKSAVPGRRDTHHTMANLGMVNMSAGS